jgi:hypothetical protein
MDLTEDPVADADYTDHEVSMAKSQMLSSMKSITRIAKHLSTKSESEGLEGWVASKLTMAEDYLQAVADYMDGEDLQESAPKLKGDSIKAQRELDRAHADAMGRHVKSGRKKTYTSTQRQLAKMRGEELPEGYKVLPPMDKEKYQARDGLEGPFSTLSGKVVYYDPKEGKYYDPDTDMYMSYDEFRRYDDDYSGMKDERDEVKEAKLSPDQREELDDLIDMVKWGTSPSTYDDDARDAAMQALNTIRSKFGDKVADQVGDGIHDFHFPKHGMAPGTYGTDRLASKKPTAIKKDGKIDSRSAKSTKRDIKSNLRGMGKKDPKRLGEADETKYGIIRYPDTAISYIKNDGNGWEHIFDKSYGFEGPVDKEDLQYAKKIEKEKIPGRMFESSEMMTEAQFDEAAGEKDACYHKVKSRYKVWPSAYASGALVKCRKVGAKNWGNSKKD